MASADDLQGDMDRGNHDYTQHHVLGSGQTDYERDFAYLVECLDCGWVNRRSAEHLAQHSAQKHEQHCGGEVVYAPDGGIRPVDDGGGDDD
jgi:hypothetical protein